MSAASAAAAAAPPALSARGARLLAFPRPAFARAHYDSAGKAYDPRTHPAGVVNLSLAENRTALPLLEERIRAAGAGADPTSLAYNNYQGSPHLRAAMARVASRHVAGGAPVDPERVVLTSGAGSALLLLATVLCDDADGVLIPAPYYYAYDRDLCALSGLRVVAVPDAPGGAAAQLSPAALSAAADAARAAGTRCRLLVITTPNNPTGEVAPPGAVRGAVEWAAARGVSVIVNELYACSVHRGPWTSVLHQYAATGLPEHVTWLWGLSKDFAASGLRVGAMLSGSPAVTDAVTKYNYFHQIGGTVQRQLAACLTDDAWVASFVTAARGRLAAAVAETEAALAAAGAPFRRPDGALFVWADLSRWARAAGGEMALFDHLRQQPGGGVLLCPAEPFRGPAGWFRICVTAAPPDHLREGLARLARGLASVPGVGVPASARL